MHITTLFFPGVLQPFVFLSFDVLHQLRYQSYTLQHHVIQVDYHDDLTLVFIIVMIKLSTVIMTKVIMIINIII